MSKDAICFCFNFALLNAVLLNEVWSVSCNWFDEEGFADGYCSSYDGSSERREVPWMYECDGDLGTYSRWNNPDCSGTADYS